MIFIESRWFYDATTIVMYHLDHPKQKRALRFVSRERLVCWLHSIQSNYRSLVGIVLSGGRGQTKYQVFIWWVSKIYFVALICFKIRLSITVIVNVISVVMPTSHKRVLNYRRWKLVLNSFQPIKKSLRSARIVRNQDVNYRTSLCANFFINF